MAKEHGLRPQENVLMMFNRFLRLAENKEHETLIMDMKQAFLEIKPIEAKEEVHARWVVGPHPYRTLYTQISCSACGGWKHTLTYQHKDMHYCPNCGARMDGKYDEK